MDASYRAAERSINTSSTPGALHLGTGASVYTTVLIPALLSAKSEIIFVTCFWAKSKTLSALREALELLSAHRRQYVSEGLPRLRMSICLSSVSLLQKIFHPSSVDGYVYPPASWPKKLGLPSHSILTAGGIDLTIKSLFFLPFSVMHPKFLIIDRQCAFLPSCNVSWEAWLEGCVEVQGPVLTSILNFYASTWDRSLDTSRPLSSTRDRMLRSPELPTFATGIVSSPAHHVQTFSGNIADVPTMLLSSSHHRNPQFRPFPWQASAPVPQTPLNCTLLRLFEEARQEIYIQTPDLTCQAVIEALLDALRRGVNVSIVTNRNIKPLEQLITAGTTTNWCVQSLIRRHKDMASRSIPRGHHQRRSRGYEEVPATSSDMDIEAQHKPGQLLISYFRPRQRKAVEEEPVQSHLKLTIIDARYTVLGSGNMDRASWYTSQELGILFDSHEFAGSTRHAVAGVLEGRLDLLDTS